MINKVLMCTLIFVLFHVCNGQGSMIPCDDPIADNYGEFSGCGCKYSDLFDGQQNSLCPSEISILIYQEWMATDYCFTFQNGNLNWTKAKYDELMTGLANIYNLSDYLFYESDVCDRNPGEYWAGKYEQPYENGDCKIDGINLFQYPPAPWDGTFVAGLAPSDLYWHIIGFLVRTEEATVPFTCCNEMFDSEDWTPFVISSCGPYGDSDGDGICNEGDNSSVVGDAPCIGGNTMSCDDNCPGDCNAQQLDADSDGLGDVCDTSPGCGGCGQPVCEQICGIDSDSDGIPDSTDNCPNICNSEQLDADGDNIGDVCDGSPKCGGCGQPACEQECGAPQMCGGFAGTPCPEGQICNYVDPTCIIRDLAGVCVPESNGCPEIYAPVCGCDGATYGNDCERVVAVATLAHNGVCIDP